MAKIQRKYLAHYIGAGDGTYVRLGRDLEEYTPELSAAVEKTRNILGGTSVAISGYEKAGEVAPYFAEAEDPLFERLQAILDGDLVLEELKTDVVEVKLWKGTGNTYPALREEAYIEINSYGGDAGGYQIPFTIHYTGAKTKGTFNVSTKTFQPEGA